MAYNRIVVWQYPFADIPMPLGTSGMTYTKVVVDVPRYRLRRDLWEETGTFTLGEVGTGDLITMNTSVPYYPDTLKVIADGELITFKETTRREKDRFQMSISEAKDKYVYVEYIPGDIQNSVGDNIDTLRDAYGIVAEKRYSKKLRETIELARIYVSEMCIHIGVEPPLWVGNKDNNEVGTARNIIPGLTPLSAELHLLPIAEKIEVLRAYVLGNSTVRVPQLPEPKYTLDFIESLQQVLIDIDTALEQIG